MWTPTYSWIWVDTYNSSLSRKREHYLITVYVEIIHSKKEGRPCQKIIRSFIDRQAYVNYSCRQDQTNLSA